MESEGEQEIIGTIRYIDLQLTSPILLTTLISGKVCRWHQSLAINQSFNLSTNAQSSTGNHRDKSEIIICLKRQLDEPFVLLIRVVDGGDGLLA